VVTASHLERHASSLAAAYSVGVALSVGVAGGIAVAAAGLLVGPGGGSAVVLGIGLVSLLTQDAYRFAFVANSRPRAAFACDLAWTVVMGGLVVIAQVAGLELSAPAVVALWVVGATAGSITGFLVSGFRPRPSHGISWLREHWSLAPGLLVSSLMETVTVTVRQYLLAGIAGLGAVGAIRAAQLILSPVTVLYQGISLVASPEASRLRRSSPSRLVRWLALLSFGLAAIAFVVGVVGLVLPDPIGVSLLGDSWSAARPIIIPIALATILTGASNGGTIGLLVLGEARTLARIAVPTKIIGSILVLGGGALAAALGASIGTAIEAGINAIVAWRAFLRAHMHRSPPDEAAQPDVPHLEPLEDVPEG
jgi:O-antigen/teichoic acid export membrane protein